MEEREIKGKSNGRSTKLPKRRTLKENLMQPTVALCLYMPVYFQCCVSELMLVVNVDEASHAARSLVARLTRHDTLIICLSTCCGIVISSFQDGRLTMMTTGSDNAPWALFPFDFPQCLLYTLLTLPKSISLRKHLIETCWLISVILHSQHPSDDPTHLVASQNEGYWSGRIDLDVIQSIPFMYS